MKRRFIVIFLLTTFLVSCARVPVTGRRQLNMLPEKTLRGMAVSQYKQFLKESNVVPASKNRAEMVDRVGKKIASAVESFLKKKNQLKRIKNYNWEFNLVEDNSINAWAMPGGKVVVYTGILPVTQDETGLAVVMGHEVAHAVARHGNERMSQQLLVQAGGIGLNLALQEKPELTRNLFLLSYGVGSTLGTLKYSRTHESEADKLGLIFMAIAGYNPEAAVDFWQRMAKKGGPKPPELLSTHPSDERRIKEIKKFLPEAKKYYKKN